VKCAYPLSMPRYNKTDPYQWILGNTFPFVVFTSFGSFWLGYGATLQPGYGAYSNYATPGDATSTGLESVGFNVGIGKILARLLCADKY
jgi:succinate-acetate transporter protein